MPLLYTVLLPKRIETIWSFLALKTFYDEEFPRPFIVLVMYECRFRATCVAVDIVVSAHVFILSFFAFG